MYYKSETKIDSEDKNIIMPNWRLNCPLMQKYDNHIISIWNGVLLMRSILVYHQLINGLQMKGIRITARVQNNLELQNKLCQQQQQWCYGFWYLIWSISKGRNKADLYKSNKRSHHHCKGFTSIKWRSSPLKGIWNSYPANPNSNNQFFPTRVNYQTHTNICFYQSKHNNAAFNQTIITIVPLLYPRSWLHSLTCKQCNMGLRW